MQAGASVMRLPFYLQASSYLIKLFQAWCHSSSK